MPHNEFTWQSTNGLKIYAQEWKPEQETRAVVALVHGLGEHSGRYSHVAARLNRSGYALVSFDLPGHGRSEGQRGHTSFAEIALEIDHLLAEAAHRNPGKPCFLYGHSLGGALGLYYVLKCQPVMLRGVIITSPGLAAGMPIAEWKLLVAKVMARLAPSFTLNNGLDRDNLCRDMAVIQAYISDPLVHDRISARLTLDALTLGEWIISHAKDFPLPLLLVQGTGDHIVSTEQTAALARAVPAEKLTYRVWEGFYHETHNEPEQEEVMQAMIDWLDRYM